MNFMKIVIIGDGAIGKSSFLIRVSTDSFPGEYIPTVADNYEFERVLDGTPFKVNVFDTPGQDGYDRYRPLLYIGTHVFLVCFDVWNRTSFENVTERWVPEVGTLAPGAAILLVGNRIDMRSNKYYSHKFPDRRTISRQEAFDLASSLGLIYRENSALMGIGTNEVLDTAIHLAADHIKKEKLKRLTFFRRTKARLSTQKESMLRLPPELPPAEATPQFEISDSTFAEDWRKMLEDRNCTDVKFIVSGGPPIEAHRLFLCAASTMFGDIFLEANSQLEKDLFEDMKWVCSAGDDCPNLEHSEQVCSNGTTVVTVNPSISSAAFQEVMLSLYKGLPDITLDTEMEFLSEIKNLAEKFRSPWLSQICDNLCQDKAYLNPSISTWQNDNTGAAMKELFLNKDLMCDVKFHVGSTTLYAHRVVLTARCDVMAAMLGGAFRESSTNEVGHLAYGWSSTNLRGGDEVFPMVDYMGRLQPKGIPFSGCELDVEISDTSAESFLALLEYLYTDHTPLEKCDPMDVLKLANKFCLPRLVTLCELQISTSVNQMIREQVADKACDVIHLLLIAQAHNASQLTEWCLHFISTNYSMFTELEEFSLLQEEHRKYFKEHQWPPLSYMEALKEYKKTATTSPGSKCIVM